MNYNRTYKTKYWCKEKYRTPLTIDDIYLWIEAETRNTKNGGEGRYPYSPLTIKTIEKRRDGIVGSEVTEYTVDVRFGYVADPQLAMREDEEIVDLLFTKSLYMTIVDVTVDGITLSITDDHSTNIDADVIDSIVNLFRLRRDEYRAFCDQMRRY